MKREFVFKEGSSNKFWNIETNGDSFIVTYGRLGTVGRSQSKSWETEEKCNKEASRLIAEKLKKGYKELSNDTSKQDIANEYKEKIASILQGMQNFEVIGEGRNRICKYIAKHIGEIEISSTEEDMAITYAVYNGQEISLTIYPYSTFSDEELKICCSIIDNYENLNFIARNAIIHHFPKNDDIQEYFEYLFENYEKDELIEIFGVTRLKNINIKNVVEKMSYPNFSFSKGDKAGDIRVVAEFAVRAEYCPDREMMVVDPESEVLEVKFFDDEDNPGNLIVEYSFST